MKAIIALVSVCAATVTAQYNNYPPGYPPIPQIQEIYPTNEFGQLPQPLISQAPQPFLGQSPSAYQLNFRDPISRTKQSEDFPEYTSLARKFELAYGEAEKHLNSEHALLPNGILASNTPLIQYVMLMSAVNQLVDELVKNNDDMKTYDLFYQPIINKVISETTSNPLAALKRIRARLDKTASQVSDVRKLIKQMQHNCEKPISRECDKTIHNAVMHSEMFLRHQAALLFTLQDQIEYYLKTYSSEFEKVANSNGAENFLKNNAAYLSKLIDAGYDSRVLSNNMPPASYWGRP